MYLEIKNSSNQLISRIYNKLNHTGAVYWVEVELNTSTDSTYSYIGIKNKATTRTIYFPIGASLVDKTYKYTVFTANDELTIPYYRYIPNYKYSGDTIKENTYAIRNDQPAISSKKFINWNSKSNGSGTKYYASGSFDVTRNISSSSERKKVSLYAQWADVTSGNSYSTNWVGASTRTYSAGSKFNELPGSGSRIDEYSRQIYSDSYSLGPATINSINIVSTFPSPAIASYSGSTETTSPANPKGTVSWTLDLYDLGIHDNSVDIGYSFKAKYSRTDGLSTWVGSNFELAFYKNSGRTDEAAARRYDNNRVDGDGWHFNLSENGVYKYVGFLASGNSKQQFAPLSEEYSIFQDDYNTQLVSKFTGSEGIITVPYPAADPTTGIATLTLYPTVKWIKQHGSDPQFQFTANNLASFTTSSIDYSVKYDKNCYDDVTNMPASGVKQYNSPYTISDLIPVREGYIFKGWNLGASEPTEDFPGIPMQPGEIIPATNNDGHYILYAQWKKEEYDYTDEDIMFLVHMKPQVIISAKRYSLEEPDRVVLIQKPSLLEDLPDANGEDKNFVKSTYRVRYQEEIRGATSLANNYCYEDRTPYSNPSYPTWLDDTDDPVLTNANGLFRSDLKLNTSRTDDLLCSIDKEWQFQSRIYDALGPSSELTYKEGTKQLSSSDKYNTLSDWSNIALLLKYVTKLLVHNPFIDQALKESRELEIVNNRPEWNKQLLDETSDLETDFWQIREHSQNSAESKTAEKFMNSLLDLRSQAPTEASGGSVNGFTETEVRNYLIPTLVRALRNHESLVYDPSQVTPLIDMLFKINDQHSKISKEHTELLDQKNYSGLDVGDTDFAALLDSASKNGRILELDGERHQTDTSWETEPDSLENRVLDTDYQDVELGNFQNQQDEDDAQSTIDHIVNYDMSQLDLKTSLSDLLYILSRMTPREAGSEGAKADFNDPSKDSTNMSTYWDSTNNRFKDSAFTNWIPSTGKWRIPENDLAEYDNPIEDYELLMNTDSLDPSNTYGENDFANNGCRATCMGLCTSGCYNTCVGGCKTACGTSCFFGCQTDCKGDCGTGCSNTCSGNCTGGCRETCSGTCQGQCTNTCSGTCTGQCSGTCSGSCGKNCSGTCAAKCKNSCHSGCTNACSGDCKNTCGTNCSASCGAACTATCGKSCKGSCSGGCNTSCGNNCSKNCGSSCLGGCTSCSTTCKGTCDSACTGGCAGSCYNGCKGGCEDTCNTKCTFECSEGCKSGCKGACKNSCSGSCSEGCTSTCANACGSGCGTTCTSACGVSCADTCVNNCGGFCTSSCTNKCSSGCQGGCKGSCSTGCYQTCKTTCDSNCKATCSKGCYNLCETNCAAACAGYCDESCSSNCMIGCTGSCWSTCNSGCSGGCIYGCYNTCEEECANACSQVCSSGCTVRCSMTCAAACKGTCGDTCYNGCRLDCKADCKKDCKNACKTSCGATCSNTCNNRCKDSCNGGCSANCSGTCGHSCSGECGTSCATSCQAACAEQCGDGCKSTCASGCKSGCKTTCTQTCGKSCYSACEATCSNTCGSNCTGGCSTGCNTGCTNKCKNGCKTTCTTDCEGECKGTCKSGCTSNCSNACTVNCDTTCGGNCTGGCLDSCTGDCTGKCVNTCMGTCTGTCEGTCTGTCFDACGLSCGGSCSSVCVNSCLSSCTGSAYKLSA